MTISDRTAERVRLPWTPLMAALIATTALTAVTTVTTAQAAGTLPPHATPVGGTELAAAKYEPRDTPEDLAQALAQASGEAVSFDIPAQPLPTALNAFGRQAGVQVTVDAALTQGVSAPAVQGDMPPAAALNLLLKGTGITWTFSDAKTVALSKPEVRGDRLTLGTVSVEGRGENAWGPVNGFVATRSATATKTDTPIVETPQSISVIGATQMENQNTQTLGEALRYTPGILKAQGFNRTDDGFYMRGFQGNTESMYLDGLRGMTNVYDSAAEPFLLERVEVLRGPASVLYGQASPAGVVSMVSKQPTRETLREIKVDGGSFSRKQATADMGGSIDADGTWSYRMLALVRDSDTMVDYIPDDKRVVSPAVTWRPNDDTTLTVRATYQNVETAYNYGYPAEGTVINNDQGEIARNRFIGEPGFNKFDRETFTAGYSLEHQVNDWVGFKQNLRYGDFDNEYADIYFGSYQTDNQTVSRGAYARTDHSTTLTLDNQVHADLETGPLTHKLVGGIDYMRGTFRRLQFNGTVGNLNLYNPSYGGSVTMNTSAQTDSYQLLEQVGFYLQDQIKFGDHWRLLIGGRQDKATNQTDDYKARTETKNNSSAFTGRAGLVYLFDNGLAPYASYAESFQPQTGSDFSGVPFKPTTGAQYEVGLKYQPPGINATFTLAAYQLTRQNVTKSDPDNSGYQVQTGEVRSRGIDLEAKVNPIPSVNLIAGYAYTQAEVTETSAADLGNRPENTPHQMASLWGEYAPKEGDLEGLVLGGGVRYVGNTTNLRSNATAPSYWVADAMISYRTGGLKLALNAYNLFDKTYIAACTYGCFYGDARTFIGSLSYRW